MPIPIAAALCLEIIKWQVLHKLSADAAAERAAAEFDYFRNLKDQEITELVFELSKQFPVYPYWEWYKIVNSLRKYGALTPDQPVQRVTPPPTEKSSTATALWITVVVVVAVAFLMWK